jgi:hypothetical protein
MQPMNIFTTPSQNLALTRNILIKIPKTKRSIEEMTMKFERSFQDGTNHVFTGPYPEKIGFKGKGITFYVDLQPCRIFSRFSFFKKKACSKHK